MIIGYKNDLFRVKWGDLYDTKHICIAVHPYRMHLFIKVAYLIINAQLFCPVTLSINLLILKHPNFYCRDPMHWSERNNHGIKYIEDVFICMEAIIKETTFNQLTLKDISVLILSVVLHNIGLHISVIVFVLICFEVKFGYD